MKRIKKLLDIKTFDKIEEALENYGLMQFIKGNKKGKTIESCGSEIILQ